MDKNNIKQGNQKVGLGRSPLVPRREPKTSPEQLGLPVHGLRNSWPAKRGCISWMAISLALETDGFAGINGVVVVYVQQQACKLWDIK